MTSNSRPQIDDAGGCVLSYMDTSIVLRSLANSLTSSIWILFADRSLVVVTWYLHSVCCLLIGVHLCRCAAAVWLLLRETREFISVTRGFRWFQQMYTVGSVGAIRHGYECKQFYHQTLSSQIKCFIEKSSCLPVCLSVCLPVCYGESSGAPRLLNLITCSTFSISV